MRHPYNLSLVVIILFFSISEIKAQCTNYAGVLNTNIDYVCGGDIFYVEVVNQVVDANSYVEYTFYQGPSSSSTILDQNQTGAFANDGSLVGGAIYLNVAVIDTVNSCDTISAFKPVVFLNPIEIQVSNVNCNTPYCELSFDISITGGYSEYDPTAWYNLSGDFFNGPVNLGQVTSIGPIPDLWNMGFSVTDQINCSTTGTYSLGSLCNFSVCPSDSIFINEIHYENTGTDIDEGVEIVGVAGYDVTSYWLYFIDGATGEGYDSLALSGIIPDQDSGFGTLWFPIDNLIDTNGGIILYGSCGAGIIQFLSYEGVITGNFSAPYYYPVSDDITVNENSATVGESLQLIGVGQNYGSFSWSGPLPATAGQTNKNETSSEGQMNSYQYFGSDPGAIVYCNQEDITINEDEGTITIEVSVTNLSQVESTELLVSSLSSTDNTDYSINSNNVSFTDLSLTSQSIGIEISIADDSIVESDENLVLELNSSALTVPKQIEITILDNDVTSSENLYIDSAITFHQIGDELIFSSDETIDYIQLFNLNGSEIVSSNSATISIADISSGVFVALVTSGTKKFSQKIPIK